MQFVEASDVACWFGAARACYTPRITASELNDNCQVFGKDRREGETLFQVNASWLVQRDRDAVIEGNVGADGNTWRKPPLIGSRGVHSQGV